MKKSTIKKIKKTQRKFQNFYSIQLTKLDAIKILNGSFFRRLHEDEPGNLKRKKGVAYLKEKEGIEEYYQA